MPCYRCGARQVDPDRGESPWRRGVRRDRQVLICPDCQVAYDWAADLDHCPVCASVHLVRRLGEVECRDCGAAGQLGAADADHGMGTDSTLAGDVAAADLANEVEHALSRVLGPSRQRPPYAMS
ncbi:MAG: hypothetical protein ACLQFR_09900 [Streptosporangiaceae bacterium]